MRSARALPRNVVLVVSFAALLALLVAEGAFALPPFQAATMRATALAAIAAGLLADFLAARWVVRVLEAAPLRRDAAGTTARLHRLPFALSSTVFLAFVTGSAAVILRVYGADVTLDMAIAGAGVGVACSLLAALLASALASNAVAGALERIAPDAAGTHRGSVGSKILSLCLGLGTIALLLFGSAGYARYRVDVDSEYLAAGQRAQNAVLAATGALSDFDLGAQVFGITGAPTALVNGRGEVGHRFGDDARRIPFERAHGAGAVQRVGDGWLVKAALEGGGDVVSWLPEAPLWERRRSFWRACLVVGICAYAAAALLAWLATAAITRPFRTLGRAVDRIASGDLTAAPPSLSRDEMGRLAADFRRMTHGLKGLVVDVQSASEGVSVGAREAGAIGERVRSGALDQHAGVRAVETAVQAMESSVALVSRGVTGLSAYVTLASSAHGEMAAATEDVRRRGAELDRVMDAALHDVDQLASAGREAEATLATLENLAGHAGGTLAAARSSMRSLERAASDAEANAAAVDEIAARAGGVVEETAHGIEALRSAVSDAHRRISVLGRRSDDIHQVVDFISEVAGRTNLLSLNASIIAAQAGEHGKAFSVVADQIRELAAQIARSTKSIGDIIHAVREDVEATASLIDRGDALAVDGVQLARNSLGALEQIQRSTAAGRETAASIRAAVEAQAESSREVTRLVESVTAGSHAVASAVQLVARSVGAVGGASRTVNALGDGLGRALDVQGAHGRRQVESLAELERMIADIAQAIEGHDAATRRVRDTLRALSSVTGTHEAAVQGLATVSDRLGSRARALADRVNRFKV